MPDQIHNIRGMNDILPEAIPVWRYTEDTLSKIVESYGYHEIRLPIVEDTNLFKRSIGNMTDIVEKEMYTFEDKGGDSLTLRPEGTAGCVRAGIQHGLFYNQQPRLWYMGPMFRHERPQKGRYRSFHQLGVEAFGFEGPDIDAELILMTDRIWKAFGLTAKDVTLHLNSLGSIEARIKHRKKLVSYFTDHFDDLDEDSRRRLSSNPLRILDSKNPQMQSLIQNAPKLLDTLDENSKKHFMKLCHMLDAANLHYEINPCLVRGLDYYSRTVFEWITDKLGAQGSICGGGHFDYLVEQMGDHPTYAAGFAIGIERVIDLINSLKLLPKFSITPDIYLLTLGDEARTQGLLLSEKLRDQAPHLNILTHCGEGNLKNQFKKADKSGARIALVLAEQEAATHTITVKYLREDKPQETVPLSEVTNKIQK
jgi:histidyl-tRNA synthetase